MLKSSFAAYSVLILSIFMDSISAIDVGYNSECQLDSECRAAVDTKDICCALLIYEANDVQIKKRECLPRSDMDSANGSYDFEGITTTDAYCDGAISSLTLASTGALLAAITVTLLAVF